MMKVKRYLSRRMWSTQFTGASSSKKPFHTSPSMSRYLVNQSSFPRIFGCLQFWLVSLHQLLCQEAKRSCTPDEESNIRWEQVTGVVDPEAGVILADKALAAVLGLAKREGVKVLKKLRYILGH